MIDKILELDTSLFLFINKDLANPVTDILMPFITESDHWLPIYILLFLWLLIKGGKHGRILFVFLILGVILTDQISASLIKEWVGRLRPCKALEDINLLVNCGSGKSFPSSHATNTFGAAVLLYHFRKSWAYVVFGAATITSLSRVFVGVHYPIDITAGAILGCFIGYTLVLIQRKLFISENAIMKIEDSISS